MKKILIGIIALVFCIAAANAEPTTPNAVDYVKQQLINKTDVGSILEKLTSSEYNMSLNDAVNILIENGGNETATLVAAIIINPDYQFTALSPKALEALNADPTEGLDPSAAGNDDNTNDAATPGNNGNAGAASTGTGGGGGGASPA